MAVEDAEVEVVAFTNEEGALLCPVMGNVIASEDDALGYQDYEGKRHYFCCAGCTEQFEAAPEKFAEGVALDA